MGMRMLVLAILAAIVMASAMPVWACPVCSTETGTAVRAGVFNDDFWTRMLGIVAPFPVLLVSVAIVHFGGRRRHEERTS